MVETRLIPTGRSYITGQLLCRLVIVLNFSCLYCGLIYVPGGCTSAATHLCKPGIADYRIFIEIRPWSPVRQKQLRRDRYCNPLVSLRYDVILTRSFRHLLLAFDTHDALLQELELFLQQLSNADEAVQPNDISTCRLSITRIGSEMENFVFL